MTSARGDGGYGVGIARCFYPRVCVSFDFSWGGGGAFASTCCMRTSAGATAASSIPH